MNYKRMTYQKKMIQHRSGNTSDKISSCTSERSDRRGVSEDDICMQYCKNDGYPSLAMVYPAAQCWRDIQDGCEGFERGTIFSELNKPFMGDKCKNGGRCK